MRFILIVFMAILTCTCFSCKKNSEVNTTPDTYYYVRFKVDGVIKEYKTNAVMNFGKNSTTGTYFLSAKVRQSQLEFPSIRFDISGFKEPFTIQTPYDDSAKDITAKMYYGENRVDEFVSLPSFGDFKIQFTERTSGYVKGTFSGTVSETYVYVPLEKKITEGRFYLQAIDQ